MRLISLFLDRWQVATTNFSFLFCAVLTLSVCNGAPDAPGSADPDLSKLKASSSALTYFEDCAEAESALKDRFLTKVRVELRQQADDFIEHGYAYYGRWGGPDVVMETDDMGVPMANEGSAPPGGEEQAVRVEGEDFSGTNNQESGVDEADFVKTDGHYIYVLNGQALEILRIPEFGELEYVVALPLEGYGQSMLLHDDKLAIFSSANPYEMAPNDPALAFFEFDERWGGYRWNSMTRVDIVDLSADRSEPSIAKTMYVGGWYSAARRVDSTVRMVAFEWGWHPELVNYLEWDWETNPNPQDMSQAERAALMEPLFARTMAANEAAIAELTLETALPEVAVVENGALVRHSYTGDDCRNFASARDSWSTGVASILSFDLFGDEFSLDADHIFANSPVVYASTDTLVLAEAAFDGWWYRGGDDLQAEYSASNLHRFDIGEAGQTRYTGSGRIDGTVNGQFALSEHHDVLRVVATRDPIWRWWDLQNEADNEQSVEPPQADNMLYTLAGENSLNILGQAGPIAAGERVWSSRFVGGKAYVVTFRNIDPLWTIDVSNPAAPTVIGELEIEGVSTYIHPVDEGTLLTVGYGGTSEGLNWWQTAISLFDVSEFANPTRTGALTFGESDWNTWSSSEAVHQHKAFQYWPQRKLLAIPLDASRYVEFDGEGSGETSERGWAYEYDSRLQLVNVEPGTGLSSYGTVDHSQFYPTRDTSWYNPAVRRSIFTTSHIYAISAAGVTAHNLDTLEQSAAVELTAEHLPW